MTKSITRKKPLPPASHWRSRAILWGWSIVFLTIIGRLFYWQIIRGSSLQAQAEDQYQTQIIKQATRGSVFTSDGYPLATNQTVYRLFIEPPLLNRSPTELAQVLTPVLGPEYPEYQVASTAAQRDEFNENLKQELLNKLNQSDKKWVSLKARITDRTKQQIEHLDLAGMGFEPYQARYYPEASMAAHILGFVGKDEVGNDTGYFGIEGSMDKELQGKSIKTIKHSDALGLGGLLGNSQQEKEVNGRDVVLTIRRDVQALAEEMITTGVERYEAQAGEIVIADPRTGKILAIAAVPAYDPALFHTADPSVYRNPSVANLYEPGSTFKTLTVAAGIDTGVIKKDTQCDFCDGPRKINSYTIRTWNDVYNPDITMTDALAKSDNIAMIFIAEKLGAEKFIEYMKNFGIGEPLHIDLQEDTSTPFKTSLREVELATNSFGQGIGATSLQMIRAVSAIANRGSMMRPMIVDKVIDPVSQQSINMPVTEERRVISAETARTVTEMMVESAVHGEAQWTASRTHTIAGKTGTSQIAVDGTYDEEKTIASFIGFAPANDPQFIMLVKLIEPKSSIWAAETAAPLWYKIANRLFLLMNIPPDRQP